MTGKKGASAKSSVVQVTNPKTGRYVKIDRAAGRIVAHTSTAGPYKGVIRACLSRARERHDILQPNYRGRSDDQGRLSSSNLLLRNVQKSTYKGCHSSAL